MNEFVEEEVIGFKYSEVVIKARKKIILLMTIMMPIIMAIVFAILMDGKKVENIGFLIILLGGLSLFMGLEMFIVTMIMFKKLRGTTLELQGDLIARKGGKKIETIAISQLKSVIVKSDPKGNIVTINIRADKKAMNIAGFENLSMVVDTIETRVSSPEIIKKKKMKFDWNNPLVNLAVMAITVLLLVVLMKTNFKLYDYFNQVFVIAMGAIFILAKPLSKNAGKRFLIFERILGGLILFFGILSLITHIL